MSFLVGLDLNDVQVQTDSGNASTTAFTLDVASTTNAVAAYISGVRQLAGTDYSVSGTTITFTTAPPTGTNNIMYVYTKAAIINTPADVSVTTAKIAANAVDETKLKDALVADFTEVTVAAGDSILLGDVNDSGNTKRDTVQGILDLAGGGFTLGTEQATTSGSSINFTGIPSGTTVIYVHIDGVSTGSEVDLTIQLRDSGGLETSGYNGVNAEGRASAWEQAQAEASSFIIANAVPTVQEVYGLVTLALGDSSNNVWFCSSILGDDNGTVRAHYQGGRKALSGTLDGLSLVSSGTFDAGAVNISYQ